MVAPSTFAEGCITRCHIAGLLRSTLCSLLQNLTCLLDRMNLHHPTCRGRTIHTPGHRRSSSTVYAIVTKPDIPRQTDLLTQLPTKTEVDCVHQILKQIQRGVGLCILHEIIIRPAVEHLILTN